MIKLCGLWANSSKDGKRYMAGKLSYSSKILIFKNDKKRDEKDPDYIMYIDQVEQKPDDSSTPSGNESDLPF